MLRLSVGSVISETAFPQRHQRFCVFYFSPYGVQTDKAQSYSCVLISVFIREFGQGYLGNMSSFILKAAFMWPSSKCLCKVSGFQSSFWFLDDQKFSDFISRPNWRWSIVVFGCDENLQTLGATGLKTTTFILEKQLYRRLFSTNQNRESVSYVAGELSCLVQEV